MIVSDGFRPKEQTKKGKDRKKQGVGVFFRSFVVGLLSLFEDSSRRSSFAPFGPSPATVDGLPEVSVRMEEYQASYRSLQRYLPGGTVAAFCKKREAVGHGHREQPKGSERSEETCR